MFICPRTYVSAQTLSFPLHRGNEIALILDARLQESYFVLACSRSLAVSGDDLRRQLARGEEQQGLLIENSITCIQYPT